jgi:TldD protein
VLNVSAHKGLSEDELNKKLLALAKDRGLKSVYYVETMGPELTPRLLYRITPTASANWCAARLDDLDQRALRSGVIAAGKEPTSPTTTAPCRKPMLAPALLLRRCDRPRANEKNDKLPFYPPPD